MAIPTTQKECTTRRIAALIIGLWDKVKNAFLRKNVTSQSTGTLPLLAYDDGIAKYNSDITIDFGKKNMLAGNSTPNSATPTAPYSNNLSIRNITSNASYVPSFHKPLKDMFVLLINVGQSTITITYGTASSASSKLLAAGRMMLIAYAVQDEGWSYVGEIVNAQGVYADLIAGGAKYVARQVIGSTAIDLNNLTFKNDESNIEVVEWWVANKGNVAHKPIDSAGTVMMFGYGNHNYVQIANMNGSSEIYWRSKDNNTWTSWRAIPVIEHVTTIPVNPTVGTIYAL